MFVAVPLVLNTHHVKKTRAAEGNATPGHHQEEDLLTQVEKTPEPLPHPYTAAP